jgi:hypothetical protein
MAFSGNSLFRSDFSFEVNNSASWSSAESELEAKHQAPEIDEQPQQASTDHPDAISEAPIITMSPAQWSALQQAAAPLQISADGIAYLVRAFESLHQEESTQEGKSPHPHPQADPPSQRQIATPSRRGAIIPEDDATMQAPFPALGLGRRRGALTPQDDATIQMCFAASGRRRGAVTPEDDQTVQTRFAVLGLKRRRGAVTPEDDEAMRMRFAALELGIPAPNDLGSLQEPQAQPGAQQQQQLPISDTMSPPSKRRRSPKDDWEETPGPLPPSKLPRHAIRRLALGGILFRLSNIK